MTVKINTTVVRGFSSIPHLIGSHPSKGDKFATEGMTRICTEKPRDKHDTIIVQCKLDGSQTSVQCIDGVLTPIMRTGRPCSQSRFKQHHLFAAWVYANQEHFEFLQEGERLCGEWLIQAHGTRYNLPHIPFVVFDLMTPETRLTYKEFDSRAPEWFPRPKLLSYGPSVSIEDALLLLGEFGYHGALDPVEGVVYRVERGGKFDFLAKYVKESYVPGKYLDLEGNQSAEKILWNVSPKALLGVE